jgi:xanthine dehydrogenase accessory factor
MTQGCGIADILALPESCVPVVRVVVASVEGSAPREAGAAMLVSHDGTIGTIGGGQLEFEAIAHARALLKEVERGENAPADYRYPPPSAPSLDGRERREAPGGAGATPASDLPFPGSLSGRPHRHRIRPAAWLRDMRTWPLGPSLGQCCGGVVRILFEHYGPAEQTALGNIATASLILHPAASGEPLRLLAIRHEARDLPLHVARAASEMLSGAQPRRAAYMPPRKGIGAYFIEPVGPARKPLFIYGAGHVGRAIVKVIAELDFDVSWVDVHADRFPGPLPDRTRRIVAQDPAAIATAAPEGAYHLVLTFSHALDLAICHALLAELAFGFLGLIGSGSKRARFMKRLSEAGIPQTALAKLTCPIGIGALRGKEPATIAISVAAQLIEQLERERGRAALDTETKREASG